MKRMGMLLGVALLVSGCGAGGLTRGATEEPAPTTVSMKTACDILFSGNDKPMAALIRLWDQNTITPDQAQGIAEDADTMRSLAERAPEPLATYVTDFAGIQQEYYDTAEGFRDSMDSDRTDLQSAGYSITNECRGEY